jgi:FkbM family methyltransferase
MKNSHTKYYKIIKNCIPTWIKKFTKNIFKNNKRDSVLFDYEKGGGFLFLLNPNTFIGRMIIENKTYEPHIVQLSKKLIRKGSVVLDIGANIGVHSLLFSKLVGQNGRVVAFEPNNLSLKKLKFHIALNKVKNVTIIEKAVADKVKSYDFFELDNFSYNSGNHSLAYTSTIQKLQKNEKVHKRQIKSTTLDKLFFGKNLDISFIKMDIEGFEYYALAGGLKLINKQDELTLIIEFNSSRIKSINLSNEAFKNLLKGFLCYEIIQPNIYKNYIGLTEYNFDRDINSDLLCIKY